MAGDEEGGQADAASEGHPPFSKGGRGDLAAGISVGTLICRCHVRPGDLAGGARQRVPFFACAKKGTKESTPRCRRNPEAGNLERAAKELAALKQLSPASGSPAQGHQPRLRQRGKTRRMTALGRIPACGLKYLGWQVVGLSRHPDLPRNSC